MFLGVADSLGMLISARNRGREAWLAGPRPSHFAPSWKSSAFLSPPPLCSHHQALLGGPWTWAPGRQQVEGMARTRASWENLS